jgi:hypothetical protein
MATRNQWLARNTHIAWKRLGDDRSILLDLNSGQYFSMNETATVAWTVFSEGKSISEVECSMSDTYGNDLGQVRSDLAELVESLLEHGLVSMSSEPVPVNSEEQEHELKVDSPYVKPELAEHETIMQMTAGSSSYGGGGGSHYWYPN